MAQPLVTTSGLRELQRDLRAIDRSLGRELNKALKSGAERRTLPRARAEAPHLTGRLAGSLRAGVRGRRIYIRSRLPYAGPIHYGWPARGIRARPFITDAYSETRDQLVDDLGDAVEDLARRHGFKR